MIDLDTHLPAIVAGDAHAFGRWLAGAEPAVRESLRSFATRVDTEAVLQEALLRAWQVAPHHTPDGRPNSLLRATVRIAKKRAIDEARRVRVAPVDDEALESASLRDDAPQPTSGPDPFLRKLIQECRKLLPWKPGQALAARLESAGAEPDEVLAERLGMKLNTFLQNFSRARKLLGECLEKRKVDLRMELG